MPARLAGRKAVKGGSAAVGVLVQIIGTGIWWEFLRPREAGSPNSVRATPTRTVLPLEALTLNLADPEDGRFLRAKLALGVDGRLPGIQLKSLLPAAVMFLLAAFSGVPKTSFLLAGSVVAWLSTRATGSATVVAAEPSADGAGKGKDPTQEQQLEGLPRVVVLAPREIPSGVTLPSLGVIR